MDNDKSTLAHRRYARLVRVLCVLLALLQLGYFLLSWVFADATQLGPVAVTFTPRGLAPGVVAGLAPALRWSGLACALPALFTLAYALWRLDLMLGACARGQMFAQATVGHMKAFAGGVLATLVLTIVEPALRALVWKIGFGDSGRAVNVGVSSEELTLVLVCALFFLVASMMHQARRIAEDNEGFV